MTLCIPERGFADIDQATWSKLEASPEFRRLHEQRVVEVLYLGTGKIRLKGTCYVGSALCGDIRLQCTEKVEGALASLLHFASRSAFRVVLAQRESSDLNDLIVLLIQQFLEAVTKYSSSGRRFSYVRKLFIGSLVGGKIDITRSIRLRARGLGHLLAFEKQSASYSIPLNHTVLAALSEVERLGHVVELPEEVRAKARGLALLFSDSRDVSFLNRERSFLADQAYQLARSERNDVVSDMIALAAVLLAHESFDNTSGLSSGLPRTWFLNLEKLFETAVRNTLRVIFADYSVFRGEDHPESVFSGERAYRANPDVVAVRNVDGHRQIADVKYKVFDRAASASDIYQLLAHAGAFRASVATLIYPSEEFFHRSLGASKDGVRVSLFGVRLKYLLDDLQAVLSG
ncbi:5-methylcytosine restriction system specificity protein McrC [Luteibacter jiangsuensis]